MSFKEWASSLYGSVGNAFKNFDKEGDGALTLSILRRACQKGKWGGDPQMLFESVGPSGSVKDVKNKQITVDDVSFLDLWPDRDSPGDPNPGDQDPEVDVISRGPGDEVKPSVAEADDDRQAALKFAPSVFERLYQVDIPEKRCASAPALVPAWVLMET